MGIFNLVYHKLEENTRDLREKHRKVQVLKNLLLEHDSVGREITSESLVGRGLAPAEETPFINKKTCHRRSPYNIMVVFENEAAGASPRPTL